MSPTTPCSSLPSCDLSVVVEQRPVSMSQGFHGLSGRAFWTNDIHLYPIFLPVICALMIWLVQQRHWPHAPPLYSFQMSALRMRPHSVENIFSKEKIWFETSPDRQLRCCVAFQTEHNQRKMGKEPCFPMLQWNFASHEFLEWENRTFSPVSHCRWIIFGWLIFPISR